MTQIAIQTKFAPNPVTPYCSTAEPKAHSMNVLTNPVQLPQTAILASANIIKHSKKMCVLYNVQLVNNVHHLLSPTLAVQKDNAFQVAKVIKIAY